MARTPGETGLDGAGRGPWAALVAMLARTLAAEGDRLFLWGPVLFGAGIALYFGLRVEPSAAVAIAAVVGLGAAAWLARPWPLAGLLAAGLLCAGLGFADAKLRAERVASPVLTRDTGVVTIKGWIERAEPRTPRGFRLTLRVAAIDGLRGQSTPFRVRMTSAFADAPPPTATSVTAKAVLQPVPEPVQPGGFDFARKAWFARLGAIGFVIARPEADPSGATAPWDLRLKAHVDHLRAAINARIAAVLPGVRGALAMALITGERGAIPEDVITALRNSGLAHVLSISGLHMALMAGALYWLVRACLAAIPALALRHPIKKWAACVALAGGAFYLVLSGAAIATQRAYIMMAILCLAVLVERPALTLRNVALAAWAILAVFPESLFDVSFQMSFAAVTALVAVYEEVSRRTRPWGARSLWVSILAKGGRTMTGIALTTLVASVAIAPYAAYHFHKLAQYSLIANMLAMPVVSLVVMPMALAALLAMPFGLEAGPLHAMAWGIDRLVEVAKMASGWPGAVIHVASMPVIALALLTLGGLWLTLWRTRWRAAGLALAALGVAVASGEERPDLLIDRDGRLQAVRTDDGVLATAGARRGYSLEQWLLADGDPRTSNEADMPGVYRCDALACLATVRGKTVALVRHPAALKEECARADIVVTELAFKGPCPKARVVVDRIDVWAEGAHALYLDGQSIRIETVAEARGERPWVQTRRRRTRDPPADAGTAFAREAEALADEEP